MPRLRHLGFALATLVLILPRALGAAVGQGPPTGRPEGPPTGRPEGHVTFDRQAVTFTGGTQAARQAVTAAIEQLLESWCALDTAGYRALLAPEVTRISRVTGIARGRDAVMAALPREWEEYERPGGDLAVTLEVRNAEIVLDGEHALAVYAVEVTGEPAIRWEFTDRWLVVQVFRRAEAEPFRLLHQSIASGLDAPGDDAGFDFELTVPVEDLARAVSFYTPLLGAPEHVSAQQAIFRAGGSRYRLDSSDLRGFAKLRPAMPNAWATFRVADLAKVEVALSERFVTPSGDRAGIALDPSGNPFVLLEERFETEARAPEAPQFADRTPEPLSRLLTAWLHVDADGLVATLSAAGFFFDNARDDLGLVERGGPATRRRLARQWNGYDRSRRGLAARLAIRDLATVAGGAWQIASYRALVEGLGAHPFRDETLVTDVLAGGKIVAHFAVRLLPEGLVRELDYSAYATEDMAASERFYREKLALGVPYRDEGWYGFWSRQAVFGLHRATRAQDHFPVPRVANGHPSFWVASARRTHAYLASRGATFPVHPSINERSGLDRQPGYLQLLSTDSEGNLLLFTEYTGR